MYLELKVKTYIINNMATFLMIDRVDNFVITIDFVTILIFGLTTMSRIVEKQGIIRLGVLDKPAHGVQNIFSGRNLTVVLRIVSEHDNVFLSVAKTGAKEIANIVSVIDAALQLAVLSEIVYANAKRLLLSIALGVLEVWLHFILVGS